MQAVAGGVFIYLGMTAIEGVVLIAGARHRMGTDAAKHLAPQGIAVGLLLDTGGAREPLLHLLK